MTNDVDLILKFAPGDGPSMGVWRGLELPLETSAVTCMDLLTARWYRRLTRPAHATDLFELVGLGFVRVVEIPALLKIHPEVGRHPKEFC